MFDCKNKLVNMNPYFSLYSKFNEPINIFVGDNSALTCETLVERTIAMEPRFVREIQPFFTLTRLELIITS